MSLRDQLALMLRGDYKDVYHNNVLIQVTFDHSGEFAINVCEPDTRQHISHFNSRSLSECVTFLERF